MRIVVTASSSPPEQHDLAALCRAYRDACGRGDPEARDRIASRIDAALRRKLVAFVAKLGCGSEAEDLAQESLGKLFLALERGEVTNCLAWVFTVARRACIDAGRRERTRSKVLAPADGELPSPPVREPSPEELFILEEVRPREAHCAAELAKKNPIAAALWLWRSENCGTATAFYQDAGVTGRNSTRDLETAIKYMRPCLSATLPEQVVRALIGNVEHRGAA